jgi:O-antigen/teichoic acid export membrane protein
LSYSLKSFSLFKRDILLFIANTITGIVIARTLGPNLRGLFAIVLLIPSYAESFGRLKYDLAAVFFLGKGKVKIGEMVFLLNVISTISSVLIIVIIESRFGWIYQQLYANTDVDMYLLTQLVLILIPLQFVYLNYSYLLIYMEDVRSYNIMVVTKALVGSGTSIILIVALNLGIVGAVIGSVLSYIPSIYFAAMKVSKVEKATNMFNGAILWEMTKYSFQYYIGGIVGHLQQYLTNLLMVIYAVPAQVGFFSMAKNQSLLVTSLVPRAVNTLLFPKIAKSEINEDLYKFTLRSYRITLLILTFSGVMLSLLVKPAVWILYGSAYLPMVVPFWIILPGFILSQSATVFNSYYSGIGRPDLLPKLSVIPLVFQGIIALSLMPSYGIIGAAISVLISSIAISIAHTIVFRKLTGAKLKEYIINRNDIEFVALFIMKTLKIKG